MLGVLAGLRRRAFRIDRVSSVAPTGDPMHRPDDFDLAESWRAIADEVDRKRTPLEARAVCAPHGIGVLRMGFGGRLEVGGSTTDGRIEVVIRGNDEGILAGELAGLVEWIEVTGPAGRARPPGLDRQRARRPVRLRLTRTSSGRAITAAPPSRGRRRRTLIGE
ncbi:WYL domain-containing protein [Jidongwangia harbinensis]|uniref:WYL domain-containing protein n=1 Tax=Jidongwangia harbinensis TaxID=2878561 RepID=UPI001CD9AE6F|nr:WYL domain-containing protein [Jidongwangia harbinensis]MCA2216921.1 WYL domain-containing protein [Jidongwangia harbinensis]